MTGSRNARRLEDDFVFRERVSDMARLSKTGFTHKELGRMYGMSARNVARLIKLWESVNCRTE